MPHHRAGNVDDLGQLIEMMRGEPSSCRPPGRGSILQVGREMVGVPVAYINEAAHCRAGCATLVDVCKWHYSDPFGIAPGRANSVCC